MGKREQSSRFSVQVKYANLGVHIELTRPNDHHIDDGVIHTNRPELALNIHPGPLRITRGRSAC